MLILLFILLIGGALFLSYYLTNEMSNQRKRILLLKHQNDKLKQKVKYDTTSSLTIKYIAHNYTGGIILNNCKLYICPIEESIVLNSLIKNTNVKILDCAEIKDGLWYEVSIINDKQINTKGWVKSDFINPFSDKIQ